MTKGFIPFDISQLRLIKVYLRRTSAVLRAAAKQHQSKKPGNNA